MKFENDVLVCPFCGSTNMHQESVVVYERNEDEDSGLRVTVRRRDVSVSRSLVGNPSGRRHAVVLIFSCEGCAKGSKFHLAQHKGETLLEIGQV